MRRTNHARDDRRAVLVELVERNLALVRAQRWVLLWRRLRDQQLLDHAALLLRMM